MEVPIILLAVWIRRLNVWGYIIGTVLALWLSREELLVAGKRQSLEHCTSLAFVFHKAPFPSWLQGIWICHTSFLVSSCHPVWPLPDLFNTAFSLSQAPSPLVILVDFCAPRGGENTVPHQCQPQDSQTISAPGERHRRSSRCYRALPNKALSPTAYTKVGNQLNTKSSLT